MQTENNLNQSSIDLYHSIQAIASQSIYTIRDHKKDEWILNLSKYAHQATIEALNNYINIIKYLKKEEELNETYIKNIFDNLLEILELMLENKNFSFDTTYSNSLKNVKIFIDSLEENNIMNSQEYRDHFYNFQDNYEKRCKVYELIKIEIPKTILKVFDNNKENNV